MISVFPIYKVPLPCPTNSLYVPFMGKGMKYPRTILSARARQKRDIVCAYLIKHFGGKMPRITFPVSLHYTIIPRDKRTPDADAYEKQLLDCLQHAGVVANDKLICHVTKELLPTPCVPGWIDLTLTEV